MEKISLDTPVKEIDFGKYTVRIHTCMTSTWRMEIYTLRELVTYSYNQLLNRRNIGKKLITGIMDTLERYGLKLGMTEEEIAEYEGCQPSNEGEEEVVHSDTREDLFPACCNPPAPVEEVSASSLKPETPTPEEATITNATEELFHQYGINLEHEIFLLAKEVFLNNMKQYGTVSLLNASRSAEIAVELYKQVKSRLEELKE